MKAAAFLAFGLVASLGACTVDDGGPADTDDPDEAKGIVCNSQLAITGTFAAEDPLRPAEVPTGCWPVGVWTFTASVDNQTEISHRCETAPALLPEYKFRVIRKESLNPTTGEPDGTGLVETYQYLTDPSSHWRLGVSEGGGGQCEGGLEITSADGKSYWNFKPMLTNSTIDGFGEFSLYKVSQL
jgi:hypothetical protein